MKTQNKPKLCLLGNSYTLLQSYQAFLSAQFQLQRVLLVEQLRAKLISTKIFAVIIEVDSLSESEIHFAIADILQQPTIPIVLVGKNMSTNTRKILMNSNHYYLFCYMEDKMNWESLNELTVELMRIYQLIEIVKSSKSK
jgi:hypothetical protein